MPYSMKFHGQAGKSFLAMAPLSRIAFNPEPSARYFYFLLFTSIFLLFPLYYFFILELRTLFFPRHASLVTCH